MLFPSRSAAHAALRARARARGGLGGVRALVHKALGILEVVQQPPGRCDEEVDAADEALGLGAAVRAAHDEAVRLADVGHEVAGGVIRLHGEFARRRQHKRADAVAGLECRSVQQLRRRDEVRERLAGACETDPRSILGCNTSESNTSCTWMCFVVNRFTTMRAVPGLAGVRGMAGHTHGDRRLNHGDVSRPQ